MPHDDGEETIDGMVEVCCRGKSAYSTTIKNLVLRSDNMEYWGDHLFLELQDLVSLYLDALIFLGTDLSQ